MLIVLDVLEVFEFFSVELLRGVASTGVFGKEEKYRVKDECLKMALRLKRVETDFLIITINQNFLLSSKELRYFFKLLYELPKNGHLGHIYI